MIERYVAGMLSEAEGEALECHFLTCARCQSELRLAAAVRAVPEVQEASQSTGASQPGAARASHLRVAGWWPGRRRRIGAVPAAIAAVLAGVLLLQSSPPMQNPARREATPESAIVLTPEVPIGEVGIVEEFRWTPVTSADLYQVTLYDAAGRVLWQMQTTETSAALADTLRLGAGSLYLWQVDARVGWDRWVSSELVRFKISEP
jgi:hypothetical protein